MFCAKANCDVRQLCGKQEVDGLTLKVPSNKEMLGSALQHMTVL